MNLTEAIKKACEFDALPKALAYIAVWEHNRDGGGWQHSFENCFIELIKVFEETQWEKKSIKIIEHFTKNELVDGIFLNKYNKTYYIITREFSNHSIYNEDYLFALEDELDVEIANRAHQGRNIQEMNLGKLIWTR